LWGERFNRPFADLFDIEEDVARQIGERLSARLGKVDRARLRTRPTTSDEAYRLYLQGRHLWYERTREGVTKSIELFRTAVELDPQFALAWNGLGDAYTVGWAGYHDLPLDEAYTRGERAVRRALELDDHLPEAHTSLAFLLFERKWDWAGAEREFQRALELDPGNAYTYQAYGEYLYCMGRFDESLARLERARELDPLSEIVRRPAGRPTRREARLDLRSLAVRPTPTAQYEAT
jgi:tetratricopeptide (TPR) repeat protein